MWSENEAFALLNDYLLAEYEKLNKLEPKIIKPNLEFIVDPMSACNSYYLSEPRTR
jgi:hypothetical protein